MSSLAQRASSMDTAALPPLERKVSLEEIGAIVRETVDVFRDQGIKRAQETAAKFLDLTVRRVRSYWQGEVTSVTEWEAAQIRLAHLRVLEARIEKARNDIERLTAAREVWNARYSRLAHLRAAGRVDHV